MKKMITMNENEKALVEAVERHNDYCYKVGNMMFDAKCEKASDAEFECIDTMRNGNIATGIELCCKMRELNIDAVVDMIWGYVHPRNEVSDIDCKVDGKSRYMTFCWA